LNGAFFPHLLQVASINFLPETFRAACARTNDEINLILDLLCSCDRFSQSTRAFNTDSFARLH